MEQLLGEAFAVRDKMEAEGIAPTEFTYCTLFVVCKLAGDWQKVCCLRKQSLGAGFSFEHLMLVQAIDLFCEMKAKGIRPDISSYNAVVWHTLYFPFPVNFIAFSKTIALCKVDAVWEYDSKQATDLFLEGIDRCRWCRAFQKALFNNSIDFSAGLYLQKAAERTVAG